MKANLSHPSLPYNDYDTYEYNVKIKQYVRHKTKVDENKVLSCCETLKYTQKHDKKDW